MFNITLLFLKNSFLCSNSPVFSINQLYQRQTEFSIINSYFSHIFMHIIYSNSNSYFHKTTFCNDKFLHILNSSIFISKNTYLINYNYYAQSQFFNDYSIYGNITVANCMFENCISEIGGGIYVLQECSIKINEVIFNKCRAKDGAGGYICSILNYRDDPINYTEYSISIQIQYCCFTQCFSHIYKEDI